MPLKEAIFTAELFVDAQYISSSAYMCGRHHDLYKSVLPLRNNITFYSFTITGWYTYGIVYLILLYLLTILAFKRRYSLHDAVNIMYKLQFF